METLNLSLQGMHCGGCAAKVSNALKAVPGTTVEQFTVGSARVKFDPNETSDCALIAAVDHLGSAAAKA